MNRSALASVLSVLEHGLPRQLATTAVPARRTPSPTAGAERTPSNRSAATSTRAHSRSASMVQKRHPRLLRHPRQQLFCPWIGGPRRLPASDAGRSNRLDPRVQAQRGDRAARRSVSLLATRCGARGTGWCAGCAPAARNDRWTLSASRAHAGPVALHGGAETTCAPHIRPSGGRSGTQSHRRSCFRHVSTDRTVVCGYAC